jgi:hypothetical protein
MAKATTNGKEHYTQLERRLVLLRWLCHQLGYADNREALTDTKSVAEGFGADGRSFLYHHLLARGSKVKIDSTNLARYDENIRMHLARLNRRRTTPITLRYFQHLAALYTEIFLDRLFTDRHGLLCDLNSFVAERNKLLRRGEVAYPQFTESDLNKLAYWMATGSGKTLLMHLNYYQFLHYNKEPLSNILLITPNEGLSEQHLAELQASGIPARRFDLKAGGLWVSDPNTVQVIEITKLVEQKSGGGVSVPVEAFEGRNLIFVDEGHKGAGGEAWRKYRDALGEQGFTFEYSATFGQALSAAGNDALTQEYSKAIIFDYSYRYFYNDGFGKDFYILNLRSNDDLDTTYRLLMGNLLTFYEQLCLYEDEDQKSQLSRYNLEKPLLVFIGSTVNAVYKESEKPRSDVLTVVRFLHRVLADPEWAVQTIGNLLAGQSGLALANGQDAFGGRFVYLRQKGYAANPAVLYNHLLERVFHAQGSSGLHLCELSRSAGELGLKAGPQGKYFGVISIGDVSEFKKLVEAETPQELKWEQDAISPSLFEQINAPDSSLHILIGAKKFIEGWNSWRVSSMGLLNIGKQEGSQIIQLFGRGVRLKGLGMSLKRSAALEGNHPEHLRLLETLNIFAVRANYMQLFREYLEREGVEVEPPIGLPIYVALQKEHLQRGLLVPRTPEDKDFATETALLLEVDPNLVVRLDLSTKVQVLQSGATMSNANAPTQSMKPQRIPAPMLDFVDWAQVYLDLLAYKTRKGFTNLVIRPEKLRSIVAQGNHDVVVDSGVNLTPNTLDDLERLQDIVTRLLCRYMDKFYQTRREQWEAGKMQLNPLDADDPNLSFNLRESPTGQKRPAYILRIPQPENEPSGGSLLQEILQLLEQEHKLYCTEEGKLSRIYFDRHIYIPLLLEQKGLQVSPPGLAPSEEQFVRDLSAFWEQEKCGLLAGKELFLLRNLSRGKGIGFFEGRGFYPDFILWILEPNRKHQRIVFIEPHGMVYAKAYIHDEKARLHEYLRTLSQQLTPPSNGWTVELDSYLVSATPFDELRERYDDGTWDRAKFAQHHILFPERNGGYDYLRFILVPPPQSAPAPLR